MAGGFRRGGSAGLVLFLGLSSGCWAAGPAVTVPKGRAISLFNGRDLAGWQPWLLNRGADDPAKVFTVTNGWLRVSGQELGYLTTREAYRDYHLVAEFRWGKLLWQSGAQERWPWSRLGKARDSGLFLHSFGPEGNSHDGAGAFKAGVECNLFQGATGDILLIRGSDRSGGLLAPRLSARVHSQRDSEGWFWFDPEGEARTLERWGRVNWRAKSADWRDVTDFRGAHDLESANGDWTRVECICRADRITVRVNGHLANEVSAVEPSFGPILIQSEGAEIFFRRLELLPLE